MTLASAGYVDVGDLELYLERHGQGEPLVLLHGAMGTIESCFAGLLPLLARHFEVLAVELQGHGHTRVGVLDRADWLTSMILAFIGAGQHR